MGLRLIREISEDVRPLVIEEGNDNKKSLYIQGTFLQSNITNKNKRFYSTEILEKAVNNYIEEKVKHNRGYGELQHPTSANINLDRVAILVTELKKSGNDFIGKAKVTSTPCGKIVEGLINDGANLGVSSRGLGTLKENKSGIMEVQSDFHLATAADVVADPSAPSAFVNGIMENTEFYYDALHGVYVERKIEETKNQISKMTSKELTEEVKAALFIDFMNTIIKKSKQ